MRVTRTQASTRVVNLAGAAITGKTPKKKILAQYGAMAEQNHLARAKQDVLDRRTTCTGMPVYGKRGTCVLCKRETQWFCVLCHMNCCVAGDIPEEASAIQTLRVVLPAATSAVNDMNIEVKNTCYLHVHMNALEERFRAAESRRVSIND
jgi:hypothetical protein